MEQTHPVLQTLGLALYSLYLILFPHKTQIGLHSQPSAYPSLSLHLIHPHFPKRNLLFPILASFPKVLSTYDPNEWQSLIFAINKKKRKICHFVEGFG